MFIVNGKCHQWRSQEFDLGGYTFLLVIAISKRVNVPHVNKTVTDFFGGIYTYIPIIASNWLCHLKKNTNYFYAVRISISFAILSEIFIQIGYFF